MNNLPPSFEYDRMVDLDKRYHKISYNEFITMNTRFFDKLPASEKLFVNMLNERVAIFKVAVSEMDRCTETSADYVYFNPAGKLCIASGR